MKIISVAIVTVLVVVVALMGAAVVRLENYRYANFVGMCSEYVITDPMQRIKRENCLENTQTRTNWIWHILYGLKIL